MTMFPILYVERAAKCTEWVRTAAKAWRPCSGECGTRYSSIQSMSSWFLFAKRVHTLSKSMYFICCSQKLLFSLVCSLARHSTMCAVLCVLAFTPCLHHWQFVVRLMMMLVLLVLLPLCWWSCDLYRLFIYFALTNDPTPSDICMFSCCLLPLYSSTCWAIKNSMCVYVHRLFDVVITMMVCNHSRQNQANFVMAWLLKWLTHARLPTAINPRIFIDHAICMADI